MKKDQILILFLVGVLLMVIAMPTKNNENTTEEINEVETIRIGMGMENSEYVRYLEGKLQAILSEMEGVGDVACMVTLSASAEQIIEKDLEVTDENVSETDSQGGTRTTDKSGHSEKTIYDDGENGRPYVSKEISPKVEGVVVIAEGGDNAVVVKNITESVQALFGIDTHKIRIVKKGG